MFLFSAAFFIFAVQSMTMKLSALPFLFCFLLALSCVSSSTRETLDRAEALLDTAPDQAAVLLQTLNRNALPTPSVRARYALLETMASDRCYINVQEDSAIRVAYDWYQHHGGELNRLKATYYLGVVRQNAGADIDAALLFHDAESIAARLKEYRYQSLCDQHLCSVYANNYDQVRSMNYARKSLTAAVQAGDSLMAGFCRLDIAKEYLSVCQFQQAQSLLTELTESANDTSFLYSYANRVLAKTFLLNEDNPDYAQAQACYDRILQQNKIPLTGQDYGHLAILSAFRGSSSDVDRNLEEARKRMETPVDSVLYFGALHDVLLLQGRVMEANDASKMEMTIQNRIVYKILEQSVTHAMENHYREQSRHERDRNRSQAIIFLLVALILTGIIAWFAEHLRRARRDVLEQMAQMQDFSNDLDSLQSRYSDTQDLLDYYSNNTIRSMNGLARAYFSWDSEQVRQKELKTGVATREEVIATFRKQMENFRKDASFYATLEHSLNVSSDHLMDRARALLSEEKNVDYELLTLFFYGFSAKSICFLKGMSEASVRMRKTRFKQFFAALSDNGGAEYVKKLDAYA